MPVLVERRAPNASLHWIALTSAGPVLRSLLGSVATVVAVPVAVLLLDESVPHELPFAVPLTALGVILVTRGGMRSRR